MKVNMRVQDESYYEGTRWKLVHASYTLN